MTEAKAPKGLQRKTPMKRGATPLRRGKPLKSDPAKSLKRTKFTSSPEKMREQRDKERARAQEKAREKAKERRQTAPLERKKPLATSSGLKSSTGPKAASGKQSKPRKRPSRPAVTAEEKSCRKIVAERSEGLCEKCGKGGGLEKAHRIARSQSGRWDPSNVLDLCHDCHHGNHGAPQTAYDHGWHLRGHTEDTATVRVLMRKGWRVGWAVLDNEGGYEWVDGPKWDESIMATPL